MVNRFFKGDCESTEMSYIFVINNEHYYRLGYII
jgi:hypothetical protein